MAYIDLCRGWIGQDKDLVDQIAGACLSCAADIIAEDAGTANHANRIAWATTVRLNPQVEAQKFLAHVCDNPTIAAALPDAADTDVKFVVAGNINTYATGE